MADFGLPPPPPDTEDPLIRAWLFELYKRNNFLLDTASTINSLLDVTVTSVADNEVLSYDNASSMWINQTLAEAALIEKIGTPVNNQLAVWTGDGTLEGESDLTFDGIELKIIGANIQLTPGSHIEFGDASTYIAGTSADNITFITGSGERLKIDGTGLTTTGGGTFSGIVSVDDTTNSSSGITGSIHTDGGLGVAKSIFAGTSLTVGAAFISTISTLSNDATPPVSGGRVFLTGGTTTITDFDSGVTGQEIIIMSDHAITITDGTNIFLNGSADFVMASTDSLHLIQKADTFWYEISRSVN